MNNDINFNYSECIKPTSHLTYTEYTNVCNGNKTKVKIGIWDYIGVSFILTILLILIILGTIAIYKMITEW